MSKKKAEQSQESDYPFVTPEQYFGHKMQADTIKHVAEIAVKKTIAKEATYKGSWAKRGGKGAFFVMARKWDRIEEACKAQDWDIFKALQVDKALDGMFDDMIDHIGYYLLILAYMLNHIDTPPDDPKEDHVVV